MNANKSSESPKFDDQLRDLSPRATSSALQSRIEQSLAGKRRGARIQITSFAAAAAVIAIGTFVFFLGTDPSSDSGAPTEVTVRPVGHQKILVEAAEPVFVHAPGSAPMWQVDLKMMNRAFFETPNGVQPSRFVPENRTVFVPVVYQ